MAHELDDVTPLTWSTLDHDSLGELGDLLTSIYYIDEPTQRYSVEDLEEHFRGGGETHEHVVVGREADSIVAYGWNLPFALDRSPRRVRMIGGVHPAFRHQMIGRKLFRWQQDRAREWYVRTYQDSFGPLRMTAHADQKLGNQRDLYARAGLRELRWFLDMHCVLADAGPFEPQPIPGIVVRPYEDRYTEAVREAHNEAFAELADTQPSSSVTWVESLSRPTSRPQWSWLAFAGEQVVGYALNSAYPQFPGEEALEGWTDRIGVRPRWRRRGICRALLLHSLRTFAEQGLESGGLGVDSYSAGLSLDLYHSIGYQETETIIQYGRDETYDEIVAPRQQKGLSR